MLWCSHHSLCSNHFIWPFMDSHAPSVTVIYLHLWWSCFDWKDPPPFRNFSKNSSVLVCDGFPKNAIFLCYGCLSLSQWGDKKYNDKAMMGSKTGWTATGCTGTATWKIGDTGKMLVVMWSIPFDQNWYKILSNHFESKNVNDTFVLMWWIPFDLKLVIPTPRMVFFFVHTIYLNFDISAKCWPSWTKFDI